MFYKVDYPSRFYSTNLKIPSIDCFMNCIFYRFVLRIVYLFHIEFDCSWGVGGVCVSIHFVKVKLYFSRLEFIYLLVRLKIFLSCLWYPFKMVLCAVRELPRGGRIKYTKFYEFSFFLLPKRLIRKAYLRDT